MRDFKKTFFLFKKPAAHAQRGDILLRQKSRSVKEPRSLTSFPHPFFTSSPPLHPFRQAVFAKQIQTFTVLKHLLVRYNNTSSNIIFT